MLDAFFFFTISTVLQYKLLEVKRFLRQYTQFIKKKYIIFLINLQEFQ